MSSLQQCGLMVYIGLETFTIGLHFEPSGVGVDICLAALINDQVLVLINSEDQ